MNKDDNDCQILGKWRKCNGVLQMNSTRIREMERWLKRRVDGGGGGGGAVAGWLWCWKSYGFGKKKKKETKKDEERDKKKTKKN